MFLNREDWKGLFGGEGSARVTVLPGEAVSLPPFGLRDNLALVGGAGDVTAAQLHLLGQLSRPGRPAFVLGGPRDEPLLEAASSTGVRALRCRDDGGLRGHLTALSTYTLTPPPRPSAGSPAFLLLVGRDLNSADVLRTLPLLRAQGFGTATDLSALTPPLIDRAYSTLFAALLSWPGYHNPHPAADPAHGWLSVVGRPPQRWGQQRSLPRRAG